MTDRLLRTISAETLFALLVIFGISLIGDRFLPYSFLIEFHPVRIIEGAVVIFIVTAIMPIQKKGVSAFFLQALYFLMFIPVVAVFVMTSGARCWFYTNAWFWLLLSIALYFRWPVSVKLGFPLERKLVYAGLAVLFLFGLFVAFATFDFQLALDLSAAYDIRDSYKANLSPYMIYLFNWIAFVILPFALVEGIDSEHRWSTGLVFFAALLLFSFSGMKAYLFAPFMVMAALWFTAGYRRVSLFGYSLIVVVAMSSVVFVVLDNSWMLALFVNRAMLLPADISFRYFEFFSDRSPLYFSQSFLSSFFQNGHTVPVPILIGETFYAKGNYANAGMLADMYVQAGVAGITVLALAVAALFKHLDYLSRKIGARRVLGLTAMPVMFFVNGSFATSFLTGGLLLALLLANVISRK